jgi:prophage antirepressor-like protein
MKDGEPWFVAKDVTDVLGYADGRGAIAKHVEDSQRSSASIRRSGGSPSILVSEGGLYALILGSKLPKAREFKLWVTDTVLPAIRKDGAYVKGEELVASGEMTEEKSASARRQCRAAIVASPT